MREDELLRTTITTIDVYDVEWDAATYEDVQFGQDQHGTLIITDTNDMVVALYARGAWLKVEVSRAPRLESTGDDNDNDGEIDDRAAAQPQPDLPRNGS